MNKVCVTVAGRGVKYFDTRPEAITWAIYYNLASSLDEKSSKYLDEAVDKSDLKEANEVIKHIMELK